MKPASENFASRALIVSVAVVLLADALTGKAALAHTGDLTLRTPAGGFLSGFTHPLFGWDHVAAMVAVGLWGAFLGMPALWILPVVFPLIMALGGVLGILGMPLPMVETGIAVSAVVLGALIAFAVRAPLWVAVLVVGTFAVFHGHAHGTELPRAVNPAVYAAGFVVATGLLHLAGIGFGAAAKFPAGALAVRAGGVLIAGAGIAFLTGLL